MFNSKKPSLEEQGMILSLAILLGVSSCLQAQSEDSLKLYKKSPKVCANDDDCKDKATECFDGACLCRPGMFTTSDGSCLSSCNLSDLENTFVAYPNSNIRGDSNTGLPSGTKLQQCMDQCAKTRTCLTFDFRENNGWCQPYDDTALTKPSQWRPKSRPNWTHYQRMCRNSVTSQPDNTCSSPCSSDSECSGINCKCVLKRCQCASASLFVFKSCVDVQKLGGTSGVYTIAVNQTSAIMVWCDMDSGDGGWLVFQRRRDGSVDFYRNWTQYEAGFGDVTGEFWLGLSTLHDLTKEKSYRLRVDLGEVSGERHYAEYSSFRVGGPETSYTLTVSGYSGTTGDSLLYHNNMAFTTYDGEHDKEPTNNCAVQWHGAWWYNSCHWTNLNGRYRPNGNNDHWPDGISWFGVHMDFRSFTFTEMKVKPT